MWDSPRIAEGLELATTSGEGYLIHNEDQNIGERAIFKIKGGRIKDQINI